MDFRRWLNSEVTDFVRPGADPAIEDWDGDGAAGGRGCCLKECEQASQMLLFVPAYPLQGQGTWQTIAEQGHMF